MEDKKVRRLKDWEDEVYLWVEQESSIMLKAATGKSGDPVELSSMGAKELARLLLKAAAELDALD
jgi:hypothetical protein